MPSMQTGQLTATFFSTTISVYRLVVLAASAAGYFRFRLDSNFSASGDEHKSTTAVTRCTAGLSSTNITSSSLCEVGVIGIDDDELSSLIIITLSVRKEG